MSTDSLPMKTNRQKPELVPWAPQDAYSTSGPLPARCLKLDANEGQPPSLTLPDWIQPERIYRYPEKVALEQQLAALHGLLPEQVLVTGGGDEAIDRICRAFLCPGREILTTDPTFEMIGRYARLTGGGVQSVNWSDGPYPLAEVLDTVSDRTAVIAVVSPNNPTGAVMTADQLRKLSADCPGCLLLVDFAYIEFADEDLTPMAMQLPNVVIVRSMSKAWGMAGLRLGYAIGDSQWIQPLRGFGSPYPVTGPSLAMAMAAMEVHPRGNPTYLDRVRQERDLLASELTALGFQVNSISQGNFVFARHPQAEFVVNALRALDVRVRHFPNLQRAIRITCPGDEEEFEQLLNALRVVCQPEAILFDMDGVLADESQSYREAIRLTCEEYGISLTAEHIATRKLAGNANNDWLCTLDLLAANGVDAKLEDVTRRFEAIYQGEGQHEGLWQREPLLVDPTWLQKLSERYPLAIVTGRPRHDAERFLEMHGLDEFFQVTVCMEDATPKPDPAPVRLALQKLGLQRAWMLGDTPDDANAAQNAGVAPLGIVAPADDPELASQRLRDANVATILPTLQSLDECLP